MTKWGVSEAFVVPQTPGSAAALERGIYRYRDILINKSRNIPCRLNVMVTWLNLPNSIFPLLAIKFLKKLHFVLNIQLRAGYGYPTFKELLLPPLGVPNTKNAPDVCSGVLHELL